LIPLESGIENNKSGILKPQKNRVKPQRQTNRKMKNEKMKTIFTITILAFTINLYSQKLVKEYWDWGKTKIQREFYTDAYGKLNGSYKSYSEYGGIMKQGQCKNDGPIGKWIENYDNGKLHYIKFYDIPGTYNFQVIDGKIISYYENGKTIKYEKNFKNMTLDGAWKEYDEKGNIIEEGKYVNGNSEPTGVSKIKFDKEQEKEKQLQTTILLKKTEEYKNIIPEADKALIAKDYFKALELYKSASDLLGNEKYPKDKISELLETFHENSKFFFEFIKAQYDSSETHFRQLKKEFKIKSIKEYNPSLNQYVEKSPQTLSYNCDCKEPWNERFLINAVECVKKNPTFYEPYQKVLMDSYYNYLVFLENEEKAIKNTSKRINFNNAHNDFYTYDKELFITEVSSAKNSFLQAIDIVNASKKYEQAQQQLLKVNADNKKKTLFKKYKTVAADFNRQYNGFTNVSELFKLLIEFNDFQNKLLLLYSQDTKELEKKLKKAETLEEIKALISSK